MSSSLETLSWSSSIKTFASRRLHESIDVISLETDAAARLEILIIIESAEAVVLEVNLLWLGTNRNVPAANSLINRMNGKLGSQHSLSLLDMSSTSLLLLLLLCCLLLSLLHHPVGMTSLPVLLLGCDFVVLNRDLRLVASGVCHRRVLHYELAPEPVTLWATRFQWQEKTNGGWAAEPFGTIFLY